jgi:cation diffusion facilitator CzcD-associated flavoprotein CzcO
MRCAIVGSGLAALAGYATLRRRGIAAEEIAVFGVDEDPTSAWRARADAIRQRRMRSESDGHLAPASFPGLAVREAVRRGSATPLLASVANRYHPSVADFVAHAREVCARSGWERSFVLRRVSRVRAVDGGFELDGDGAFAHVLLATGHPGLARVPGAVHAYEPHEYAAKVAVVGAGMAAATEWLNALAAGAEVVSIRRREPVRRPLNVPRQYFSKRGLRGFHALTPRARAALLEDLTQPSYPPGRAWDDPVEKAMAASRFRVSDTCLTPLRPGSDPGQTRPHDLQVISATGFLRGWQHDPLLADMVAAHDLPTHERWIVLAPDSTVPALTNGSTLSIAGVAGQWAFPAADTIAGAKYAARAFANRVCRTR